MKTLGPKLPKCWVSDKPILGNCHYSPMLPSEDVGRYGALQMFPEPMRYGAPPVDYAPHQNF